MKLFYNKLFEKIDDVSFPFFKYIPKKHWDYYVRERASRVLGYKYNHLKPNSLNEKIRWLIYNEKLELKTKLTDKILMKSYVAKKIGNGHTAELYGIYTNFNQIDFSILPDKYALKANSGWKMNVIVKNKDFINTHYKSIKELTNIWLKTNFELYSAEPQYKGIKRKLLIEHLRPIMRDHTYRCDYKVHCINGKPMFIEIPIIKNEKKYYQFYTPKFELLPFTCFNEFMSDPVSIPTFWDQMLEYATKLSEEFSYVRVDFAPDYRTLHVVELTFTPCAAMIPFSDNKIDFYYGELLEIPTKQGIDDNA